MKGLIATLLELDAQTPLFRRGVQWIHAGQVRAAAVLAAQRLLARQGDVYLHTQSAANLVAGILAASLLHRRIVLPAHAQGRYLEEIGCTPDALLDDTAFGADPPIDGPPAGFAGIAHNPAISFFTSGTTGCPKRVDTQMAQLELQIQALEQIWGGQIGHVRGTVSHQHIYGLLFRVLWPILTGRRADEEMALYWEQLQEDLGPEVTLISSPAHLTRLPADNTASRGRPKSVFSSGQALPFEAAKACALAFGQPPIEVLGSTETGGIAWRRQDSPASAWTPLPNVRVFAASDGALETQSPSGMDGGVHRTGDGILLLPDGCFHLRPRQDRIEKIDGKRVSLTRVEQAVGGLAEIASALALTLPARKQSLAAIVTLTDAGKARHAALGGFRMSRQLRAACAQWLEPAERPKHWRFVEAIPTDSQGKHVLSALRALFDAPDVLAPLQLEMLQFSETEAEISFVLAPDLIFFDGHFPQRAILPGIAQVHIAVLLAKRFWQWELPSADMARVKFRHILQPHDRVRLKLTRDLEKQRLRFSYHLGEIEAALGELGLFS